MTEPAVAARQIVKRFGSVTALDGVSITVERGQLVGVLGWNAAGKTTFLRLVAGLIAADSGTLTVLGNDLSRDRSEIRKVIGYMPQSVGVDEFLSVEECIELHADLCNVTGRTRSDRAAEILRLTGLTDVKQARVVTLAPAMKRRLGLACALVGAPRLLLLDEPTANLDRGARRAILGIVRELVVRGVTVLWSSSYADEMDLGDRMILLHRGRALLEGPPHGLARRAEGLVRVVRGAQRPRAAAVALRAEPGVLDVDARGGEIRILIDRPDRSIVAEPGRLVSAVAPRLEDAVIKSLLDGREAIQLPSPVPRSARAVSGPVLEVRDLCKRFARKTAVQDVSFTVSPGEVFGLVGPNGSGKSTVLRIICGALRPSSGEVFVDGISSLSGPSRPRTRLAYVPQRPPLQDNLTVRQHLRFLTDPAEPMRGGDAGRICEVAAACTLEPYLDRPAGRLDGAGRRRLALAIALLAEPALLLLDGLLSDVDPVSRRTLWRIIDALAVGGVAVVIASDLIEDAERCDRIALLDRGRARIGTPDEVRDGPASVAAGDTAPQGHFLAKTGYESVP